MATLLRRAGTTAILDVSGKLALGDGVDDFRSKWTEALTTGCKNVVVNLAQVPMIDSSGMGSMIRCHAAAVAHHGRVKLVGANDTVRNALQITHLDAVFDFYEDEAAALASLAPVAASAHKG